MAMTDLAKRVEDLLEPLAEQNGFELVAVEQAGGRHTPIVRVLLDCEGGIGLEEISEANRWIGEALEAADPISGPYTLEVSSPGIDRPLRKRSDYERFAGETVIVKTKPHGQARANWTGQLLGIEGDDVQLDVDGEKVAIPLDSIQKARLKGVVSFNKKGADAR